MVPSGNAPSANLAAGTIPHRRIAPANEHLPARQQDRHAMIQPRNRARRLRRKPASRRGGGIINDGRKHRRVGHEPASAPLSRPVDQQHRAVRQQDAVAHRLRPVWQRVRRLPRRARVVGVDGIAIGQRDGVGNVARGAAADEDGGRVVGRDER